MAAFLLQEIRRGADAERSEPAAREKTLILVCASLISSLIALDTNVVAVSLPSIARDVRASFTGIEWVISAYILTFAALLLPAGSLADLHGRRRMVIVGLAVFLVSSAVCGLARSERALEAARAAQGIGGSLLLTSALAIIASSFRGAERQRAYAFWGSCLGIATTVGPIVGGIITGLFGWRWVFLVNVPLCVVFIATVVAYFPESRDPLARRFDWFGVVTLSAGLFSLTWALIEGNAAGWTSGPIVVRLAVAIGLLRTFGAVEALQSRPMLDLRLFGRRNFLGAAFGMAGYGAGAQVMTFFLPLFLQGGYGFAPLTAGIAMLPFALPLFVAPRLAASFLDGRPRRSVLVLALGIVAVGNLLLAVTAPLGSYVIFAGGMLVAGVGAGILNPETAKAMQAQIPPERAGMASGLNATTRFTGLLVGVALLGAVMAHFHPVFGYVPEARAAEGFAAVAAVAAGVVLLCLGATAALMTRQQCT